MQQVGATLSLVQRMGRLRYLLGERIVRGADPIMLCFAGGWVTGRFEWTGEQEDRPRFHYAITLVTSGEVEEGSLAIPEGAVLRWPE